MAIKKKDKSLNKTQEKKGDIPITQPDPDFEYISKLAEEAITNTTRWEANQEKWYKLRMRIKKEKTFPFIGCSNIRMPTAEIKIRKLKASLFNVIFGIRPVVQVIPSPSGSMEVARKIEKFLDHLIVNIICLPLKAIIAIDQMLEKGFYLLKPFWRLEITKRDEELSLKDISIEEAIRLYSPDITPEMVKAWLIDKLEPDFSNWVAEENEKSIDEAVKEILNGKDKIRIRLKDVLYNFPDVALCPPERVFVPSDSPMHPQECEFLIHEFFMPLHRVQQNVKQKGWSQVVFEEIKYWQGKNSKDLKKYGVRDETSTESAKSLKEGIDRLNSSSRLVRIWEFYGWYDLDNDGELEKCLITCAPDFGLILRRITLPFNNGKFPFVKLCYEITDDRWFSHRGVVELMEDIIKEIDIQHMQKIDNQTIRNAPMFVFRAGLINPNLVKFIPGQGIPVPGMNPLRDSIDILQFNNPNVEFSYEREQMILESKIEELIGQIDFTLQSMINKRQPRTLGEVQLQYQNMQMVFSLDANVIIQAFSELFGFIWDLWCQYGDDEYEFAYFGKDGWEKIKLTREEIQGKYKIEVRGNDQNTNPQVRLQKAQMIMMASQNPIALQTGVVKPHHLAEAYDLFYKELDIPEHQRLHEDPNILYQQFISQAQTLPPAPIKVKMSDLTDAEQAQVLQRLGIQPDIQGKSLKSGAIIQEKQVEQTQKEIDNLKKLADVASTIGGEEIGY